MNKEKKSVERIAHEHGAEILVDEDGDRIKYTIINTSLEKPHRSSIYVNKKSESLEKASLTDLLTSYAFKYDLLSRR
jgi:hypothetical protein